MSLFAGHSKNWTLLLKEVSQNRLPPAYLFYGSPGIGKKLVATTFVRTLFCLTEGTKRPCEECEACRKVVSSQHPDFYFIGPDGKQIKIDQIRDLQKKLALSALEAQWKVIIIDEAHRLNQQAANSLLKTLEDPPSNTLFILIAPTLFGILPTIRSRCRRLYFSPPSEKELSPFLSQVLGKPHEEMKAILNSVGGSAELACQVVHDKFGEVLEGMENLLRDFSFTQNVRKIESWSKEEVNWDILLQVFKKKYFDGLNSSQNWSRIDKIDLIEQARRDIERNVNKQLVLENLMMELRG